MQAEAPENVRQYVSKGKRPEAFAFFPMEKTDAPKSEKQTQRKMGAFIYRRLPYPDVPLAAVFIKHQYENREGPVWTDYTGEISTLLP